MGNMAYSPRSFPPFLTRSAFSLAFLLLTASASAQITYDGCVDVNGVAVASVRNNGINDVARATFGNNSPVILYNTAVLAWLHPETRLFVYAHECGHHALGHLFHPPVTVVQEQQADCWAINTLLDQNLLPPSAVSIVQGDIVRASPGDWTHLPGPQRAFNLRACITGHDTAEPPPKPSNTQDIEIRMPRGQTIFTSCNLEVDGDSVGSFLNDDATDEVDASDISMGPHSFTLTDIVITFRGNGQTFEFPDCAGQFRVTPNKTTYWLDFSVQNGRCRCFIR